MNYKEKLQNFYEKFLEFKTLDGTFNFKANNTNFNLKEWIDELRKELYVNEERFSETIIKEVIGTPYLEFEYAWKYVRQQLDMNSVHFFWNDEVSPTETDFYVLQNLSTFIFSLLNRVTMIHYILDNQDYLDDVKRSNNNLNVIQLSEKIKDKLKRVTFNNWRYNPLIKEYENSILWKHYLLDSRNINEHYGVLFKVGGIDAFNNSAFTFYPEIIIVVYFFLFYLDKYVTEFKENH